MQEVIAHGLSNIVRRIAIATHPSILVDDSIEA
jgi:hypothetical protein